MQSGLLIYFYHIFNDIWIIFNYICIALYQKITKQNANNIKKQTAPASKHEAFYSIVQSTKDSDTNMKNENMYKMTSVVHELYAAPAIELIDLCTEAGFAQSSTGIVDDLDETDYGTY